MKKGKNKKEKRINKIARRRRGERKLFRVCEEEENEKKEKEKKRTK